MFLHDPFIVSMSIHSEYDMLVRLHDPILSGLIAFIFTLSVIC